MFKKVCMLLIVPLLAAGLLMQSGCSPRQAQSHPVKSKVTIGFSMDTLKEERWYKDEIGFVKEAEGQGADVVVDIDYDNAAKQLEQVKQMISKGIDVLVIIPHDTKSAANAVSYAKKNGVKVISYDRLILNANADLYISFDNVKVGELQAASILKAASHGNYVIVNGPSTDYNTVMIDKGIMNVLNSYIDSGKIKIVKQVEAYDWMADVARSCILGLRNEGQRINAVIAENDQLAGGVIDALSESQLIPSVPVAGMDADLAACQRVVEGQQYMTVYKPIDKLAKTAADIAVKMAKNEKVNIPDKISDGTYMVPYYKIDPIAVLKDNMASTVVKDGFHTVNEVYLNVPKSKWPAQ